MSKMLFGSDYFNIMFYYKYFVYLENKKYYRKKHVKTNNIYDEKRFTWQNINIIISDFKNPDFLT